MRKKLDKRNVLNEPVVITGVGLITSLGNDRESVWNAVQQGRSGVRSLTGFPGLPDGHLLAATVDLADEGHRPLKVARICEIAAGEALRDAKVDFNHVDRDRFGCWVSAHMGDDRGVFESMGVDVGDYLSNVSWLYQWLPNYSNAHVARKYGLRGPRLAHSTACASGLISMLSAMRSVRDGQCDMALVGSGETISRILAAGFHRMRVLAFAEDPASACRPFDVKRSGFVLGEGSAMFVIERLGHALCRGAKIYAQIPSCRCLGEAHHITGLDENATTLSRLIDDTLYESGLGPTDIGYISAHGTATKQNDIVEMRGIHRTIGKVNSSLCVSATKAMHGHLLNAAGCVELALTVLAMRDGFAPPTLNLTNPDPECLFDSVPLVGRPSRFQHALKLSLAFGGHLVAVALSRWNDADTGFQYPKLPTLRRRAA